MTEQEKFEAYANTQGYSIEKDEQWLYRSVETFCHWGTWQAAIASREPWQPIETAPKDGTKFLALYGKDECFTMYWLDIPGDEGLFIYDDELLCDVDPAPEAPRGWMPLPPPPKE